MTHLRISTIRAGYHRAGLTFNAKACQSMADGALAIVRVAGAFTPAQLTQLREDPNIKVTKVGADGLTAAERHTAFRDRARQARALKASRGRACPDTAGRANAQPQGADAARSPAAPAPAEATRTVAPAPIPGASSVAPPAAVPPKAAPVAGKGAARTRKAAPPKAPAKTAAKGKRK
jgi:hypothetical protein